MLTADLLAYRQVFENELINDILDYWITYSNEKDGHGFYGAVDMNNLPVPGANKSCVLNARILWTFSAAAMRYQDERYAGMAGKAYRVLCGDFSDPESGGYFMELTADNHVADDIKHTYAQAFAIYSLCKYYQFNPSEEVMNRIQRDFYLFEEKTKVKDKAGYGEAFTRDWQPIGENRMADHNEPRSMNTHLHVMEAYAALYSVWKNEGVKLRLRELLMLFTSHIIRND